MILVNISAGCKINNNQKSNQANVAMVRYDNNEGLEKAPICQGEAYMYRPIGDDHMPLGMQKCSHVL